MTTTATLQLDEELNGGLLVPFGNRDDSSTARDNNNNNNNKSQTLFAEVSSSKRQSLLGSLWNRSRRGHNPSRDTSSLLDSLDNERTTDTSASWGRTFHDEQKESARRHSDRKTTTFAFPNAPVEQADIIDDAFFNSTPKLTNSQERIQEDTEKEEQEDSEDESSDDDDDGDDDKNDNESDQEPLELTSPLSVIQEKQPITSQRNSWANEAYTEPPPRHWTKDGFGSEPLKEDKKGVLGRVLGRFGRGKQEQLTPQELERHTKREEQKSLRSMKVSTENTLGDKTLAETITKAALVVLVPELFADDDSDENLGLYRTISTTADDDTEAVKATPILKLQQEVYLLQKKVKDLEKLVKSAELEANAWKLRAKELEAELTKHRGGNSSDDSDDEDEGDDEDDGIEVSMDKKSNLSGDAVFANSHVASWSSQLFDDAPLPTPKLNFDPLDGNVTPLDSFSHQDGLMHLPHSMLGKLKESSFSTTNSFDPLLLGPESIALSTLVPTPQAHVTFVNHSSTGNSFGQTVINNLSESPSEMISIPEASQMPFSGLNTVPVASDIMSYDDQPSKDPPSTAIEIQPPSLQNQQISLPKPALTLPSGEKVESPLSRTLSPLGTSTQCEPNTTDCSAKLSGQAIETTDKSETISVSVPTPTADFLVPTMPPPSSPPPPAPTHNAQKSPIDGNVKALEEQTAVAMTSASETAPTPVACSLLVATPRTTEEGLLM